MKLIPFLNFMPVDKASSEFKRVRCAHHGLGHPTRANISINLANDEVAVGERNIDGKSHEERVDAVHGYETTTGNKPHCFGHRKMAPTKKAYEPPPRIVGQPHLFCQ